jgi:RHS repeat-associated protein
LGSAKWQYEYTLKDHLGNGRVYFKVNTNHTKAILQETHPDPYGFELEGLNVATQQGNKNPYTYNGKELERTFGLGWSDYGARWYDASIGRWNAVDPLAEKYQSWSPYNYTMNNPIRFIDPDGMGVTGDIYNKTGSHIGNDGQKDNRVYVANTTSDNQLTQNTALFLTKLNELVGVWGGLSQLNITHDDFIKTASTVYGESSFPYYKAGSEELKNEMSAIASVHHNHPKMKAFGINSEGAVDFRNTSPEDRNGTKMQYAVAGVINSLTGGKDISNDATNWDGKEQAQYGINDNRKSVKIREGISYELHMNTRGWTISNEHYAAWKKNIGSSFIAPQEKAGIFPPNKGKITYQSTAAFARTIFWKEINIKK